MRMKCNGKCTAVRGKSTSSAFKGIQVGDIINFSAEIKPPGRNGGNLYATYIRCLNLRTGEISNLSANQLPNVTKHFEFEEVE